MANGKFVAYYRVSTAKQGESGLGLESQQQDVRAYLNGGRWTMVGEFTEVESGKRSDRPKLAEALRDCRVYGATLIIAKLDRLARNVAFTSNLMEAGVDFIAVDNPTASRLTVHILAAVAEDEAKRISDRTKAALAAAKARGMALGGRRVSARRFGAIAAQGREASAKVRRKTAAERAANLMPAIHDLRSNGAASLRQLAAGLNERGIPTARGGMWSAVQVQRVLHA
jgi:DNA invertase Pin-like site-specific DNA recombinase